MTWTEYCLEDLVERFIDYRGKTPVKTTTGIPLVTAKIIKNGEILEPTEFIAEGDYLGWMTRGFPRVNDVVLTTEAPLGEVALIKDEKIALAQRVITLQTKPDLCDSVFLKYLLQSPAGQNILHAHASGSTVEGIKAAELKRVRVSVPHLPEQRAIAEILSSLDDKIDLLHRQNKTLEQLAETLFRQWFLPAGRQGVEEAEEGWEEKPLSEYIEFDPREKIDRSKGYKFFDMKCLSNVDMHISEGTVRKVSSATSFRNFDTLLAKITPCLENGKTGFVMQLEDGEVARGSTEFIVMRSRGKVSPYWIYCLARDPDFREVAIQSMTGSSGRQRVQVDLLKTLPIRISADRMTEFHATVRPYFLKVGINQRQIDTLGSMRDTLLPELMKGSVLLS